MKKSTACFICLFITPFAAQAEIVYRQLNTNAMPLEQVKAICKPRGLRAAVDAENAYMANFQRQIDQENRITGWNCQSNGTFNKYPQNNSYTGTTECAPVRNSGPTVNVYEKMEAPYEAQRQAYAIGLQVLAECAATYGWEAVAQ